MPATAVRSAEYQLRCLGPVELLDPGFQPVLLRTRKQRALLYLLASRGGAPMARDQIVEFLWSEDGPARARHSLAQAASLINKALDTEAIGSAGKELIALRPGVLALDVAEFESHAAAERWEEAGRLWRGDLLEDLWVQRAPAFERWLAQERERLRRIHRQCLRELIERRRAAAEWGAMRTAAEALLMVDPLDESAMLAYLDALILLDDRTLALRRYGDFERQLREELGADPGPALAEWARRHRRGDRATAIRYVPMSRVAETQVLPAARPLLGRDAEFALLWQWWEATKQRSGSFVLLEGDPGIGKTSLAAKLANQVHILGGSVAFVKCYRTEKAVPFAPITALIRQFSQLPGFVALDPVWIGELTRLVPELRERYPHVPQPMAIDDSARLRLCDATVKAAECLSEEEPLLIVVDDVHDADEASLALLHYLGRQTPRAPILEIGIGRTGKWLSEAEITFFEASKRGGLARGMELGRLPDADIERLAVQTLAQRGIAGAGSSVRGIVDVAAGNPLHAIEASLAMSPGNGPAGVAQRFEAASAGRLAELGGEAKLLAAALAVAGRPLTEYELTVMTAIPAAELAAGLTQLEAQRFLRRQGAALTLAHDTYREIAETLVDGEARRKLHMALAEQVRRSGAENPQAHFEAAHHLELAGLPMDALAAARAAAGYAATMGTIRSKAEALELAMRVTNSPVATDARELGESLLLLNDVPRLKHLTAQIARAGLGLRNDVAYFEVAAEFQNGRLSCDAALKELTELLVERGEFWHRADAMVLLLRVADKVRAFPLARSLARQLRKSGSAAHALYATGYVFAKYYGPRRALPLLERALAEAQKAKLWTIEQQARDGLGIVLKQLGLYRDSLRQFELAVGLARRTMDPQAEVSALQNRAVTELSLGELEQVGRTHAEAIPILRAFPGWVYGHYQAFNNAIVSLYKGRYSDAHRQFLDVRESCVRTGHTALLHEAVAGSLLACIRESRRDGIDEARQFWLESPPPTDGMIPSWLDSAAHANLVALDEDPARARTLLEERSVQLMRRDVANWLALELERLVLEEWTTGRLDPSLRSRLSELGCEYESRHTVAIAQSTSWYLD